MNLLLFKKIKFNKLSGGDLLIIPIRIADKSIKAAKTDKAKEILVNLAHQLAIENMKRLHVAGYEEKYPKGTKAYHEPPSLLSVIKGIFSKA